MRHSSGRARRGPCALQIAKDGPAGGNPLSGRRERKGGILEEERPGGLGAARRGWERRPLGGSGAEPSRDVSWGLPRTRSQECREMKGRSGKTFWGLEFRRDKSFERLVGSRSWGDLVPWTRFLASAVTSPVVYLFSMVR